MLNLITLGLSIATSLTPVQGCANVKMLELTQSSFNASTISNLNSFVEYDEDYEEDSEDSLLNFTNSYLSFAMENDLIDSGVKNTITSSDAYTSLLPVIPDFDLGETGATIPNDNLINISPDLDGPSLHYGDNDSSYYDPHAFDNYEKPKSEQTLQSLYGGSAVNFNFSYDFGTWRPFVGIDLNAGLCARAWNSFLTIFDISNIEAIGEQISGFFESIEGVMWFIYDICSYIYDVITSSPTMEAAFAILCSFIGAKIGIFLSYIASVNSIAALITMILVILAMCAIAIYVSILFAGSNGLGLRIGFYIGTDGVESVWEAR